MDWYEPYTNIFVDYNSDNLCQMAVKQLKCRTTKKTLVFGVFGSSARPGDKQANLSPSTRG